MSKPARLVPFLLLALLASFIACKGKQEAALEVDTFRFVVYPGARYLGQLTDSTKAAHRVLTPAQEPPATAIYDTDAPLETVAQYYAKEYGYKEIAPDLTNDMSVVKPPAFYRVGDLAADVKSIEELLKKMNMPTDISNAVGSYKAADITARPNRPHVTIQRPYFDVTTSQVVDRTLILMSR